MSVFSVKNTYEINTVEIKSAITKRMVDDIRPIELRIVRVSCQDRSKMADDKGGHATLDTRRINQTLRVVKLSSWLGAPHGGPLSQRMATGSP